MAVRKTDYSAIAPRYDTARSDMTVPVDRVLADIGGRVTPVFALDVGCGTGNYIRAQLEKQACLVDWTGSDPSEEMLEFAKDKLPQVQFVNCPAEDLGLSKESFDFIYSSFAIHHFTDRGRAFDEMARVLKPTGTIRLVNISPEFMEGFSVYRYFDTTLETDLARHPSLREVVASFKERGFQVEADLEVKTVGKMKRDLIDEVERRDNSMLAILHEERYQEGLTRVYAIKESEIQEETAMIRLRAWRDDSCSTT
jgi:ubiquinone/menaquinone biosynthesis C-methylase UbiE